MARSEKKRYRVSLLFFFIGIAGLMPMVLGLSDSDWIFPPAFIGLIVAIVSMILFFMFKKRAGIEGEFFVEEQLIADWETEEGHIMVYPKGVIYDGEMYLWNSLESSLEGVGLDPTDSRVLIFVYRLLAGRRVTYRRHTIEVSIPDGQEEVAAKMVEAYNKPLPDDFIRNRKESAGTGEWEELEDDEA